LAQKIIENSRQCAYQPLVSAPNLLFIEDFIMKPLLLPALACLLLMSGCARTYVLTLSNGDRIQTHGKPRLEKGFYYFKDVSGRDATPVFSGRVTEIAPASMASPNPASAFKPVSK
jgi:hypothetical protein